jgi:hypothetical protein
MNADHFTCYVPAENSLTSFGLVSDVHHVIFLSMVSLPYLKTSELLLSIHVVDGFENEMKIISPNNLIPVSKCTSSLTEYSSIQGPFSSKSISLARK